MRKLLPLLVLVGCGQPQTEVPKDDTPTAPLQDGVYTLTYAPDAARTTCSGGCGPSFTANYGFTYLPGNKSYTLTTSSNTASLPVVQTNHLQFHFAPVSYTHVNGCPGTEVLSQDLQLLGTYLIGVAYDSYSVEACNGHPSLACVCAFSITTP